MSAEIFDKAKALLAEIEAAQPQDAAALEQFRIKYIGSKGLVKDLMAAMKVVANEDKKTYGQLVNTVKQRAEAIFQDTKNELEAQAEAVPALPTFDLTAPAEPLPLGSRHPVSIVMNKIVDIFSRIGFTVAEEREIEDDWHNFTAMNTPEDHPARDMQDTFYVQQRIGALLRTHTSSVQSRVMTQQQPPIRIIAPGRVYRNETVSARSHCQFHQVEGLYIAENVSFADLKQTLFYFAKEMYGASKIRLRPSYFPFTEPSAEMDVYWGLKDETDYRITKGTGWLEVLGCGMVDPKVLENCGIDSSKYSGFAFGMGIERQAMLAYRISDIRLLFENDVRFLKQFEAAI
jgi:phenylalanyl-tRNA synthetase alpha chain